MSKFTPFEVSRGGNDRLCYENCVFPMGTYNTGYDFELVTWKYGRLPIVFSSCDFHKCVFDRVDLRYVVFLNCKFDGITFRRCKLDMANFIDCTGRDFKLHNCEARDMIIMHSMLDGIRCNLSNMRDTRITVNTEYLAPLTFVQCDMQGVHIENVGHMQYHGIFGEPSVSERDRLSVKTDRCSGKFSLEGFRYVAP